jgi:hypothetical protein
VTPFPETKWLRVNPELRCPICGRPDWCLIAADRTAAICPRTESPKRCGDAGYLHRLADPPRPAGPPRVVIRSRPTAPDLTDLARQYHEWAVAHGRLTGAASGLGLPAASLIAFGCGWSPARDALAIPMRDPLTGRATGIRLRRPDGSKLSVRGGREALFLPEAGYDPGDLLLICEGATDAIAAHSVGFPNAAGRPSCTGGTRHLIALVRNRKPAKVVIVADGDRPGIDGAESLARSLALYTPDLRVVAPPAGFKDLRAWVRAGATRADVNELTQSADARRANIRITDPRGKK